MNLPKIDRYNVRFTRIFHHYHSDPLTESWLVESEKDMCLGTDKATMVKLCAF